MQNEKWTRAVRILFVVHIPILCIILCALKGHWIGEVFLPAGWISDEVSYFKQIQAIVEYGMPKGYWGYYESAAEIGTFGAWPPFRFLPYALLGKVIGWSYFTPILCNAVWGMLSCFIWLKLVKPSVCQMFAVMAGSMTIPFISRYTVSALTESFVIALIWVLAGLIKSNCTEYTRKKNIWTYAAIFLLSMQRPYFAVLFFLPCCYTHRKGKKANFICSFIGAVSAVLSYEVTKLFYGQFFYSNENSGEKVSGLRALLEHMWDQFWEVAALIREGNMTYGYAYLLMAVVLTLIFIKLIVMYKKSRLTDGLCVHAYVFFAIAAIFCSILGLYDPHAGSRHAFLAFMLGVALLLTFDTDDIKLCATLLAFNVMVFLLYLPNSSLMLRIPLKSEVSHVRETESEMQELLLCRENDRWANTIIVDRMAVDYNFVYYLPSFLGVQLVGDDFFTDDAEVKSGYMLTGTDGKGAEFCRATGWKLLYENASGVCIYAKNE